MNAAIIQIPDTAWTAIHYPNAFVDEDTGQLVSDAEVTEIPYLAFCSHPNKRQVHGRLIVRRVKCLNPSPTQNGLFDACRHHAVSSPAASRWCRPSPSIEPTPSSSRSSPTPPPAR